MAMFSYACAACGLAYEVAREDSRADDEAYCPVCGEAIGRVRETSFSKAKAVARLFFHAHGSGPGQHRHW